MKRTLRAGVIGLGSMGRNHARIYHELHETELVGVADIDRKSELEIAQKYNCKGFTDYRELLRCDLDLVSIAVPTSLHKDITLTAADAEINILVEKPIADNLASASAIIDKCKMRGVQLQVGHVERFNPAIIVIKNRIANLSIISINIIRLGPLPPRIKDVGVVIDLASHDIDVIRFLTGSGFRKLHSMVAGGLSDGREDTALLSFEMENGVLCHINTNWLTPFKVREVTVAAKEKYIKAWLTEQRVSEYEAHSDGSYTVWDISVPYGEPLKLEIEAFVNAIVENKVPPVTGEDGFKALEIALQCLRPGQ